MRTRKYEYLLDSDEPPTRPTEPSPIAVRPRKENESINSGLSIDRLKQSASTKQYSNPKESCSNLQIHKLESKVLEMQKKMDHQKFQIESITSQTEFYIKTCEEQATELGRNQVQTLKQEYEDEIEGLLHEKQSVTEVIINLTEEYGLLQAEYHEKLSQKKAENSHLTQRIEEALSKKEAQLNKIAQLDTANKQNQQHLACQEERIDELRNIERKLYIAQRQLQSL